MNFYFNQIDKSKKNGPQSGPFFGTACESAVVSN